MFTPTPQLLEQLQEIITEVTAPEPEETCGAIPAAIAGLTNPQSTVFLGSGGVKSIETGTPVAVDNQLSIFSCTKSMTAFAALKLYEEGRLDLDKPASAYLPLVQHIGVVDPGTIDKQGNFAVAPRAPKSPVRVRDLFLHTAGFSYNFLSKDYYYLARKKDGTSFLHPTEKLFTNAKMPLLFEPGSKWSYGHSTDVLGLVVSYIVGRPLGEYLQEVLFDPVGMSSTTFHLKALDNYISPHFRGKDSSFKVSSQNIDLDPEIDMGGQGAVSTVPDYLRFLRVWLNYGFSPDTNKRVLAEDTVRFAIQNHLPPGVAVEFDIPNAPKTGDGFSLTGNAISSTRIFTGRPAGSLYWGGLANLFYWIDFHNGIAGFWGSSTLPPFDPIAATTFFRWEKTIYREIKGSATKL